LREGAGFPPVRDVNLPLSLLGSGRRIGAGPGLRPALTEGFVRAIAIALLRTREEE